MGALGWRGEDLTAEEAIQAWICSNLFCQLTWNSLNFAEVDQHLGITSMFTDSYYLYGIQPLNAA